MRNKKLEIGQAIKLYRRAKKMTQKELGEQCGVTGRAISRLERGQGYKMVQIPMLMKITSFLEIPNFTVLEALGMKKMIGNKKTKRKEERGFFSKNLPLMLTGIMTVTGVLFLLVAFWVIKCESSVITDPVPICRPTIPGGEVLGEESVADLINNLP